MSTAEPDETISTTAARDRFADILNRAAYGKERVVLTRRGRPLVAVVPIEDVERLEALEDERDAEEVRRRREAWERAGRPSVSIEDVAARHGVDLAAADED
jgi:prevent-host-death family protein